MKTKIIPFDLEIAKKIQVKEINGRIVQNNGLPATILAFDINGGNLAVRFTRKDGTEGVDEHQPNGKVLAEWCSGSEEFALVIELPEETSKQLTLADCYEGNKVWIKYDNNYILIEIVDKNQNGVVYVRNLTSQPKNLCFSRSTKVYNQKPEFKPFDKVLVRCNNFNEWEPDFYWRKGIKNKWFNKLKDDYVTIEIYYTIGDKDGKREYKECISFDGNEHLVGTTNNP